VLRFGAELMIGALLVAACSDNKKSTSTNQSGSGGSSNAADPLGPAKKATGTPVKVGVFNVEGGSAVNLPEIGDAAVAAANYANDYLGGLNGHVIEIDRCADKADGASATACGNKFVQNGDVAVVATQPAEADQAVPTIIGAGIPYVGASPAATSEITSKGTFFFSPGFIGILGAMAQYDKDNGKHKMVMFGADNPQLTAAVNAIGKPLFTKAGGELQLVPIPQGTADATSQIQAGLGTNPDIVSVIADTTVCISVLNALQTASYAGEKVTNCGGPEVLAATGDGGKNQTIFGTGDPQSDKPEAKLYRDVMNKYAPDAFKKGGLAPNGYLAMLAFVRAVNASGGTDATAASILTAIKAAKNVPLPLSETGATFSCDKNQLPSPLFSTTICNAKLFIQKLTGGKIGPSTAIDPAPLFAA
jgi:branched-chain amino acid transport system substrate-binding protein